MLSIDMDGEYTLESLKSIYRLADVSGDTVIKYSPLTSCVFGKIKQKKQF